MVIRNDGGEFVMGKNLRTAGQLSVMEAEGYGVEAALSWIQELQLSHVVIESSCCATQD